MECGKRWGVGGRGREDVEKRRGDQYSRKYIYTHINIYTHIHAHIHEKSHERARWRLRTGRKGEMARLHVCSSHRITSSLAGSQPTPIVRRVTNMPISLSSLIGTSAVHFRTESIPVPTLRSRWREHKQWVKWTERARKREWHETEKAEVT